ncbi:MAG: FG-GAP-like repeat-containing protein [Planctomycetota bacterium]
MSPQFVDFNGDGSMDIVAGIFDGSPHVAFGDGEHWSQPVQILDEDGHRIVMNQFWNFDEKKWDSTDRCNADGQTENGHLTSAWAVDYDGDGDHDLLLGDHDAGMMMLRRNNGTNAEPRFATTNEWVHAAGEPLNLDGDVATMRMVDWNGDGRDDLVVSSIEGVAGFGSNKAAVLVYLDEGEGDAVELGEASVLLHVDSSAQAGPQHPSRGFYAEPFDYDGDGDLDLVVGGQAVYEPQGRELSDEEKQKVEDLRSQIADIDQQKSEFLQALQEEAGDMSTEEGRKKHEELFLARQDEYSAFWEKQRPLQEQLGELVPGTKRETFVWLYENVTGSSDR